MVVSAQVTIGASGEPSDAGPREPERHAVFSVLLIEDNEADAYLVCDSLANSSRADSRSHKVIDWRAGWHAYPMRTSTWSC